MALDWVEKRLRNYPNLNFTLTHVIIIYSWVKQTRTCVYVWEKMLYLHECKNSFQFVKQLHIKRQGLKKCIKVLLDKLTCSSLRQWFIFGHIGWEKMEGWNRRTIVLMNWFQQIWRLNFRASSQTSSCLTRGKL